MSSVYNFNDQFQISQHIQFSEPFDSRDVSKIRNEDRAVLAYLKNCRFNLEKAFNMMVSGTYQANYQ